MTTAAARFWSKVDKDGPLPPERPDLGPCWLWTASLDRHGYGQYRLGGRTRRAHGVAYESVNGPIADGLEPDHLCRRRACVRPSHLEPVTHAENLRRAKSVNGEKTVCSRGHAFTPENTYKRSTGGRTCRKCRVIDNARYRRRKKARERARRVA